jgi:hypothetical protein
LTGDPVRRLSWKYLSVHAGMVVLMADALQARAAGERKDEQARWEALYAYIVENEVVTEEVFDVYWFRKTFPVPNETPGS